MTYRILLIDHDPDESQTLQRVLTDGGYDVVLASEAGEAMRSFEEVRPDLAVIEALLPDKPGAELCKEIRATAAGKVTPIVLLLEPDEDKQARARALDLHDCDLLIERSIEPDELLRLCEQLLETRRAQAAASGETAGETVDETEEAAPVEPPTKNAPLEESEESEEVLDSGGLADALSQLDTIIDRQHPPEEVEQVAAAEETDEDAQQAKTRRAERAGDFSYIADEMSDATTPAGRAVTAEAGAAPNPAEAKLPASTEMQSAPVPSAATNYGNNEIEAGQDISDHLDSLFSPQGPGEPTKAEEQVLSWTFDNGALPSGQAVPGSGATPPVPETALPTEPPSETAPQQPEPTVEAAAPAPEFPDLEAIGDDLIPWIKEGDAQEEEEQTRPEPAAEAAAEPAASPVAAAPASQTASFAKPRPQAQPVPAPTVPGMKKWWLVAACVAVVAIGGTFLIFFRGGSKGGPASAGMGPGGKPPVAEAPLVAAVAPTGSPAETAQQSAALLPGRPTGLEPAVPPADTAEPTRETEPPSPVEPTRPAATVPAPVQTKPKPKPVTSKPSAAKPKPVASKPATTKPKPVASKPSAAKPKPVAEPRVATPEPAPSKPAPAAVAPIEQPAPAPRKEPAQSAPRTATPVAAPKPEPVAVLEPEPVEVAVLVPPPSREPAVRSPEPEPAPAPAVKRVEPKPTPVEPVITPLELLSQIEPAFPPKSLKRARGEGIVLKLLVNEKGRVSRVLVEQGTSHKDLEAAAVGAVLGWKYRPAMEDGVAVKSWTTAEFTF